MRQFSNVSAKPSITRSTLALKLGDGRLKRGYNFSDLFFTFVFRPRPEKPFQAVAFAPGYNMHVEVRHALAHTIVDGYEGPLSVHRVLGRSCKQLDVRKQFLHQ